jgi:hypothetical protein
MELVESNDDIRWEPETSDSYTGPQGGRHHGPLNYIINISHKTMILAGVFGIVPCYFSKWSKITHTNVVMTIGLLNEVKMIEMDMIRRKKSLYFVMLIHQEHTTGLARTNRSTRMKLPQGMLLPSLQF